MNTYTNDKIHDTRHNYIQKYYVLKYIHLNTKIHKVYVHHVWHTYTNTLLEMYSTSLFHIRLPQKLFSRHSSTAMVCGAMLLQFILAGACWTGCVRTVKGSSVPEDQCILERADNLQGALKKTSAFWPEHWQGYQPVSSWYRRTLYRSCNSQLRSPHFTCVRTVKFSFRESKATCSKTTSTRRKWANSRETAIYSTQSLRFVKFDGAKRTAHPQYCRG